MNRAVMNSEDLNALGALTFNWTRALQDVWAPTPYHVEGLHAETAGLLAQGISEASADGTEPPLGIVIRGERGVGKTHLLGWTREQVQRAGGYFFLVGDLSAKAFWEEVLGCVVEQLLPLSDGSRNQLGRLLAGLADKAELDGIFRAAVTGQVPPSRDAVRVFVAALRRADPKVGLICQDTARALALLASPLQEDQDVGYYFLTGNEVDVEDRRRWGINSRLKLPRLLVSELSRLLALAGPTVIAVDQIDALIDELVDVSGDAAPRSRHLADMATGLMTLRDITYRTLTVVSCLPESWDYLRKYGVDTVADRFRMAPQLQNIPSAAVGRLMIEKRFAADCARVGFEPPYPTWPILPAAFDEASRYTARALLKRIEAHVSACLQEQTVTELARLDERADGPEEQVSSPGMPPAGAEHDFAELDALYARLIDDAGVSAASNPETEDSIVPALLAAGLEAWVRELGEQTGYSFVQDPVPGKNPRLHACLRMVLDARTERQHRWGFRAIASDNARAVQSRLKKAAEGAGLDAASAGRELFVLRSAPWPAGKVTERETDDFAAKGGVVLPVAEADLKTFHALGELLAAHHRNLNAWLLARRPAHRTELLERAFGGVGQPGAAEPSSDAGTAGAAATASGAASGTPAPGPTIHVGVTAADRVPVSLDLSALRRHVSIFAGSGSGKTVVLRRLIEECALHGVSSIVLDPNNDLARLGDAWPETPRAWADGDAERASDYLANTDVAIWTPCRDGGRPLTFQPLPEFGAVRDDADEFNAAVSAAVEALAPRVNVNKDTVKAKQEKAVLTEALRYFGREGRSDLNEFIALLSDLPQDASTQSKATVMAADLADRLRAVRAYDPLFAGTGESADPGLLLTPPIGKRARVSVVSLVGLPNLEQRQSFVNQLQMALFSWIKQHPAGDRPLGGLLVMDEAQDLAPSVRTTPCTVSTLRLVSQARKYGLGLLFATQSPKSLHNSIPGNSTTQFFGLLNSPAQIDAARELAKAKGADVPDIGRLSAGQFYATTEGVGFRQIRTPMCLSYHPASPLTEEEVIKRSRSSAAG
jgi:DNA helicase HerA-like ATPase